MKTLWTLLFLIPLAACGGASEEKPTPEASESPTGCALERGGPLPANLRGDFQLVETVTYEGGKLTSEEAGEKTIRLTLTEGQGNTGVEVRNTLTDQPTGAKGRVSLEGPSQLAVTVEESTIPLVFAGATYCLRLEEQAGLFDVILEVTREKVLHYRFGPGTPLATKIEATFLEKGRRAF